MDLSVEYGDTTHVIPVSPIVEVAFERQFKGGFAKLFRTEERSEHLYWLAWEGLRRAGVTVPPFGDEFLALLKSVEIGDSPNG